MHLIEEKDDRFYIKTSTIPDAGLGCFAKELLKADDWIEVIGVYVKKSSAADRCTHYAHNYKFMGTPDVIIAGKEFKNDPYYIVPFGYAGMINHSEDVNQINCLLTFESSLKKRSEHAGCVIYRFIRDIQQDEELIGNYGNLAGEELRVIGERASLFNKQRDDIGEFLELDLYNLGLLKERM